MIDEMDYTLKRLDEWYMNRFREKYTSKIEEEFKKRVFECVEEKQEFRGTIETSLSRDSQIRDAEIYFSREYMHLEDLFNEGVPIGAAKKLIDFVNVVRQISSELFPSVVLDGDISDCFKKVFSTPSDFADALIGDIDANRFELEAEYGTQTGPQTWNMNLYINSLRENLPYLTERVFGDLYR